MRTTYKFTVFTCSYCFQKKTSIYMTYIHIYMCMHIHTYTHIWHLYMTFIFYINIYINIYMTDEAREREKLAASDLFLQCLHWVGLCQAKASRLKLESVSNISDGDWATCPFTFFLLRLILGQNWMWSRPGFGSSCCHMGSRLPK